MTTRRAFIMGAAAVVVAPGIAEARGSARRRRRRQRLEAARLKLAPPTSAQEREAYDKAQKEAAERSREACRKEWAEYQDENRQWWLTRLWPSKPPVCVLP